MEKIIAVPFGYIMDFLYRITNSYGLALIVFALIVQAVMLPISIKNKRNSEKKKRLKPVVEQLRKQYEGDSKKQEDAICELYAREKVSLGGGFLWSLLPFFVLIPLFQVIRQPIVYVLHESAETAQIIVDTMRGINPDLFVGKSAYAQLAAINNIAEYADAITTAIQQAGLMISPRTLEGLNFGFLGLDLSAIPNTMLTAESWKWDWLHIGTCLMAFGYTIRQIINIIKFAIGKVKTTMEESEGHFWRRFNPLTFVLRLAPLIMTMFIALSVPVALSMYWLISGFVSKILHKCANRFKKPETDLVIDATADTAEEVS